MRVFFCLFFVAIPLLSAQDSNFQQWINALTSSDTKTTMNAAIALGSMREKAAPAVPALIHALERNEKYMERASILDENVKQGIACSRSIVSALGLIGEAAMPAIPTMMKVISGEEPFFSLEPHEQELYEKNSFSPLIARTIARFGEKAIPDLLKFLRDENEYMKWHTLDVLERIKKPKEEVIAAFIEALADKSLMVRCKAAIALGEFGENAAVAIPRLFMAFHDEKNDHQGGWSGDRYCFNGCYHAAVALGKIGRCGELHQQILPIFLEELSQQRPLFMPFAIIGLGYLRERAASAVPYLILLLNHPNSDYHFYAIETLGMIGEAAAPTIPA
jgi:HEAT repeat protein